MSIPFSTKERPDGLEVVAEAARAVGMKFTTYVRTTTMRQAISDVASARAAKKPRKAG